MFMPPIQGLFAKLEPEEDGRDRNESMEGLLQFAVAGGDRPMLLEPLDPLPFAIGVSVNAYAAAGLRPLLQMAAHRMASLPPRAARRWWSEGRN
ncbi:MAG: hypothetical protein ACR2OU_07570, partial [Thermomicrobiales bacterium]